MRIRSVLFIALILAMTGYSCKNRGGKFLKEGEIHYNIDYKGSVGSMPREIMPKTMVVFFKNNKMLFEMLSPFGNSGIQNLSNPEKGIYDTYFSLFTIKRYYASQPGEIFPGFEAMNGMTMKETNKTTIICGYNCKNYEVTFPSDRAKTFDIWYTNEINIKNPNGYTPFFKIDGVLMSFCFIIGPSELHFDVENVYPKEIPDETFERRDKYVRVSREDIDKFINKMISL